MPDFLLILAAIGIALAGFSFASRPRIPPQRHPVFTSTEPPMTPTEPDQRHHDDRFNNYLSRFNQWYSDLSDDQRATFDENVQRKLVAYRNHHTTPRCKENHQ